MPQSPRRSRSPTCPEAIPCRGRAIFSGDQARCAQCHVFRGQGGKVGPDLTDIGRKGRAEIYRSIAAPSAAIEPDYTSYTVATKAGQVVAGVVRAEGPDAIQVTDTNAHATIDPPRRDPARSARARRRSCPPAWPPPWATRPSAT